MAWSNPTLLFGTLLVAAPIVLHLLMKQKPKRIEFPAIRFVVARKETTARRMRLQHFILLALRCLLIALLALALARPSVSSAAASRWAVAGLLLAAAVGLGLLAGAAATQRQRGEGHNRWLRWGLAGASALVGIGGVVAAGFAVTGADSMIGDQEAPIAAALVFDVSPRMELLHANETSIQRARQLAQQLLRELPPDSEVAVLDSRREGAFWVPDRGAARTAIERLESTGAPSGLPQVIADAVDLTAASSLARKEIYVFTDLADAAWDPSASRLSQQLKSAHDVMLYVMDVGVQSPTNLALGDLSLSATTLPQRGELRIATTVRGTGVAGEHRVRLELEELNPSLPIIEDGETKLPETRPRDRQQVTVVDGAETAIELVTTIAQPGVRHGRLVIESAGTGDALKVDNERHFTVEVRQAWPVLIATGPNAAADFMTDSLAPGEFQDFDCQVAPQAELATLDLSRYAAVCLLDPASMDEPLWKRLEQYANSGGSLWIQLGRNARADVSFNGAAQAVLGAPLVRQWRSTDRGLFYDVRDRSHPALRFFRDATATVPWPSLPVFKHWVLEPLPPQARVLAGYSANSHPAMFELPVGQGIVVVSSTPLSDVKYSTTAWNELAFGENNWPPFILCNELMLYLVRGAEQRLNYMTGETVELANDERDLPRRYQLFLPAEPPQDVTSQESRLRMPYTATPGAYRLKGSRGSVIIRGFSCNLPAQLTRLERLPPGRLDDLLGADQYQLTNSFSQLQRVQDRQRVGREFFSLLMILLAGVLAVEYVVANRFYRASQQRTTKRVGMSPARQVGTPLASGRPSEGSNFASGRPSDEGSI